MFDFTYWIAYFYSKYMCNQDHKQISIPIVIDDKLMYIPLLEKTRVYYPSIYFLEDLISKHIDILLKYDLSINKDVDVVRCEDMEIVKIKL